jgi:small nuclear ribonucleoprotein (snRNP)-like protein
VVQRIGELTRNLSQPPCLGASAILIGKMISVSEFANVVRFDVSECPVVGISAHSVERNLREASIEVEADFIGQ